MNRNDIARLAGVSSATVSRVVNNHKNVSSEVREKVLQVIDQMNYKPSAIARSLKMTSPRTLVYFAPNIRNPYFSEIYKGINDYARSEGYTTVILDNKTEAGSMDLLTAGKVDGVVIGHKLPDELMEELKNHEIPAVFLNTASHGMDENIHTTIKIDIYEATCKILRYLFSQGHTKIGMLVEHTSINDERYEAYKSMLEQHGLPFDERRIAFFDGLDYSYEQGYRCMEQLLDSGTDVSAVIANNDLIAIGGMRAAFERGFSVPRDFSFVGFDNIPVARYYNPSLTTVKLFEYEQGLAAGKMLLDRIEGREVKSIILDTELILRESVRSL